MKRKIIRIVLFILLIFSLSMISDKYVWGWDCRRAAYGHDYFVLINSHVIQDPFNTGLGFKLKEKYGHEHLIYNAYKSAIVATDQTNYVCWDIDTAICTLEYLVPGIIFSGLAIGFFDVGWTVPAVICAVLAAFLLERISRLEALMADQTTIDQKQYAGNDKMHHFDLSGHESEVNAIASPYYDAVINTDVVLNQAQHREHFFVLQHIYKLSTMSGENITTEYISPALHMVIGNSLSVGLHKLQDFYAHKPAYQKMMNQPEFGGREEEFRVGFQEILKRVVNRTDDFDPYYLVWTNPSLLIFAYDGNNYSAIDEKANSTSLIQGSRREFFHHIIYDAAMDATTDFFKRIFSAGSRPGWF